ncbi:hypothetical protein CF088_10640 [Clostridium botulinum]|uniref:hypothetical protein n=1 Tax=Clostridium botulinum TaxID=1491 RepID=UPI0007733CA8|nr:hypothetical protein [Clostridium botulinum]MBN3405736.1 hypothetical protein [Clostridium botulinum]NEZ83805.1 hypothetical protein [Clostridium botulinum]NFA06946.1 hypothetical protein [Clostridium botulinum]NFA25874.1 hypothetical protein [Clostridium botulinum]NFB80803.1 hypothetical protein [Clostridium botulinum]
MSINKLIIDTLNSLGVPTRFQTYEGKEETYITFFCYNEQGERFADDTEIATGLYMQVDIWSKGNIEKLKEDTVKLLKANGFVKRTIHDGPYEPDTGIFHKVLRFFYYVKNEEE